jgi:hypothetical protein
LLLLVYRSSILENIQGSTQKRLFSRPGQQNPAAGQPDLHANLHDGKPNTGLDPEDCLLAQDNQIWLSGKQIYRLDVAVSAMILTNKGVHRARNNFFISDGNFKNLVAKFVSNV